MRRSDKGDSMKHISKRIVTVKSNCQVILSHYALPETKVLYYHNTITDDYLIELGKRTAGESPGCDLKLQVIELCDTEGPFIRRSPADTWRIGPENAFVFAFTRNQGNATISAIRYYAGDATTELGSGVLMSEILPSPAIEKTTDFIMNIVYIHNYKNA